MVVDKKFFKLEVVIVCKCKIKIFFYVLWKFVYWMNLCDMVIWLVLFGWILLV